MSSDIDDDDDGGGGSRGNSERARNKNNRPLNPLCFWVTRTKSNMNIFIKNLSHFVVEKKIETHKNTNRRVFVALAYRDEQHDE